MICIPRWVVFVVAGVIAIAALWAWRERPEPTTVVVHRVVTVKEARRDLPPVEPGIVHRVLWGEVTPSVIETSPVGSDLRTVAAFCGPVARADSSGDSSVAIAPTLLLLGGTISGRNMVLHGVLSTAQADRREFRLRDSHGGVEWVVHDSTVTVRERRSLRLLGFRPTIGFTVGGGVSFDRRPVVAVVGGVTFAR